MSQNPVIRKRPLGKTNIQVTPVGLGVMQFSGGGGLWSTVFPTIPQSEKNAIIRTALDGGINWFDTAELYGGGTSERTLAAALKAAGKSDEEVVVATKWSAFLRTAGNIRRSIDDRLRNLDGYSVSLFMVHQPTSFSSPEAEMEAMADLVEAGKIRSVGVSNFDAERMRRAYEALHKRGIPLAANQVHYSLLHRDIETDGILETAKELGVTIIAYTPLGYGLLTGKYHKDPGLLSRQPVWRRRRLSRQFEASRPLVDALQEIAGRYGVTAGQVALNWLIHFHGDAVVTIPGATRVKQAEESAGAMRFRLSEAEMAQLDELSRAVGKSA
ncbi:MAG: aldo/keto reductase [Rudaea sp.]